MMFKNLTPHSVTIASGGLRMTIEKDPKDPVVRIEETVKRTVVDYEIAPGMKLSVPFEARTGYTVVGLPEPQPGVMYIVSSMVATRVKRADVVSPITDATAERDETGRVLSVRGLQTYTPDYDTNKVVEVISPNPSEADSTPEEVFTELFTNPQEGNLEEIAEELLPDVLPPREFTIVLDSPIVKFDADMLDPIKAAAKAKYEKRVARTKTRR